MTPLWLTNLSRRVRQIFGSAPSGFPDEWQLLQGVTVDARGWLLGQGVTLMPSHPSWHYAKLSTPTGRPLAIVAHYTSTNPGTAINMARRRMRKFGEDPDDRQASWHVSVESDGSIVQQVAFTAGTWHAGSPTAVPIKGAGWANRVAIGVELVGHGKVWPEAQVIGAARLWRALIDAYAIPRALAMVTHQELDPGRKADPGALFMKACAPNILEYAFAE